MADASFQAIDLASPFLPMSYVKVLSGAYATGWLKEQHGKAVLGCRKCHPVEHSETVDLLAMPTIYPSLVDQFPNDTPRFQQRALLLTAIRPYCRHRVPDVGDGDYYQ